jgi:hypothetical protein
MVLLFGVWLYSSTFLSPDQELSSVVVFTVAFATLPVIGLYFSLAKSNFISSFIWTLLTGVALPSASGRIAALWAGPIGSLNVYAGSSTMVADIVFCGVQGVVASLFAWRLHESLRFRKFALDHSTT